MTEPLNGAHPLPAGPTRRPMLDPAEMTRHSAQLSKMASAALRNGHADVTAILLACSAALEVFADILTRVPDLQDLLPDEPAFLLRGKHLLTPAVIQIWALALDAAATAHGAPHPRVNDALRTAAACARYPNRTYPE